MIKPASKQVEKKKGGGGRKKVLDVGRRFWREENICIHMADPKCRTAEIHTTSWDNYSQIKKEKRKKVEKTKVTSTVAPPTDLLR